jgi:HK97 family phage portal protein
MSDNPFKAPAVIKSSSGPQSDLIVNLERRGLLEIGSRIITRVGEASAMRQSIVSGATDIIGQDIAKVRLQVIEEQNDAVADTGLSHDWGRKLMLRPNAYQTWVRFWLQAVSTLALRQEVVILRRRKSRMDMTPDLVVLQHGEWMQAVNGSRFYYDVSASTEGRVAMIGFASGRVSSNDVIHIVARSFNGYEGVSTLAIGADTIGLNAMMQDFQAALVKGGTRPTGYIKVPGRFETEQQFLEFQKQIIAAMKAATKSGEPLVLGEGAEFTNIGLNASSADLTNAKAHLARDTARLFRMPPHKLGMTEDLNRSNLDVMEKAYVDDTLVPICEVIEQDLTAALLTEEEQIAGLKFRFNREQLYDRDPAARRERIENQFKEGITFLNEARRQLGQPPVPEDQDHRRLPVNAGMVYRDGKVQVLTHNARDPGAEGDTAPVDPAAEGAVKHATRH